MLDVTSEIHDYREAVRGLWNSHFMRLSGRVDDGDLIDLFEKATAVIFDALVLSPNRILDATGNLNIAPFSSLIVEPETLTDGHIFISRDSFNSGYWDAIPSELRGGVIKLHLIGFFDWSQFGYIDLRFIRARVFECSEMSDFIGRDVLVDMSYAKVFCLDEIGS
jgi:hypothetical protein